MAIQTETIHTLFGVRIDDISTEMLEKRIEEWLNTNRPHLIFTPNPEFLLAARANPEFATLLNKSDLSLPDGAGLTFAIAALKETNLEHRQTGVDTLLLLARICAQKNQSLLLLGGAKDIAQRAKIELKKQFSSLRVYAINPGIISTRHLVTNIATKWRVDFTELFNELDHLNPDVIAVGLGQGKQEEFILGLKENIPRFKIAIGVGGAFDTISGRRPRAPSWMRRFGFEWLWRVFIEPQRIHRILRATIVFPILVISDTLKHRRFLRACRRVFSELSRHFTNL